MKTVFELTAHDGTTDSFISKQFYSNRKAAKESFLELKLHLLEKYKLDHFDCKQWSFSHDGDHQTEILSSRFNITLVKWNVSKEVSEFIKD